MACLPVLAQEEDTWDGDHGECREKKEWGPPEDPIVLRFHPSL